MRKKLLAVLLALALVLAFSGMAMAVDFTASVESGSKTDQPVLTGDKAYTIYADTSNVNLKISGLPEGYTVTSTATTVTPDTDGSYTCNLTDVVSLKIGPSEPTEDNPAADYVFTVVNVSKVVAEINANLYDGSDSTAAAYKTSGTSILVPTKLSKVYAKISVKDKVTSSDYPTDEYTVSGSGKPNANGYAAIPIDDFTDESTVVVKMGSFELEKQTFSLLRPTLKTVVFNDEATDPRDKMYIKSGTYTYNTKDEKLVDSDWSPVYFKPTALAGSKADIAVKRSSTPLNPDSKGWYNQRMTSDVYTLNIEVSVGSGDDAISQAYTIYLMAGDYEGPTVKSFEANESSNGRGDDYITVVDQESKTVYVFLPDGETSFYANVTINGDIKDNSLKLGSKTINEGTWNAAGTSTSQLKYADEAGIEYKYAISVIKGNEKYDDATLKSLTVKNGSKASTASEVDIGFDPKVTEYAFPVTDRDVWLNIAAKANDSNATVFINGHQATSITETKLDTDEVTEYEILVVAGDGVTSETYTVTVNGSTGLLQSLSASNVVGLTPAFDADFNTYTAYTAANTNSTYIVALAKNYSSDYVQVSKANFNAYGQVTSYTALTRAVQGAASVTGELKTGTNIFRIDVLSSASATSAKASYYLTINVPTANPKCVVSSQKLYINGKAQTLSAYNIAGNNYLKLRDVAALLDGTVKEMNVDWDASKWTASMVMPGTFVKRGDELTTLTPPSKYALSTQYFTYNAKPVFPLAYNVTGTGDATGSNYVMLRDVASLLDFGVTYTPTTQTININTASEYIPGL